MPPYETFKAFWMLSTFLLNWMFANKSHGAAGWHDSPWAPLRVILPRNSQGMEICIPSMTNLAVCFHMAGVHIIYFSTPFLSPFILTFPSLSDFTPLIVRLLLEPVNVLFQSFVILQDFVLSLSQTRFGFSCWSRVEHQRGFNPRALEGAAIRSREKLVLVREGWSLNFWCKETL